MNNADTLEAIRSWFNAQKEGMTHVSFNDDGTATLDGEFDLVGLAAHIDKMTRTRTKE